MYVKFNRSLTKSQIESLGTSETYAKEGMIYFANDGNSSRSGVSVSCGGLYVGEGGSTKIEANNTLVEDSLSSTSTTNALSAKKGKDLNDAVSTWVDSQMEGGGVLIDYNDSGCRLSFVFDSAKNTSIPYIICDGTELIFKNLSTVQ